MFRFFLFAVVCSLLSLVSTLPVSSQSLVIRDVWVPPITCPNASTVWCAGGTYNVTWDTSSKPSEVTNPLGAVYLRINGTTQSTPVAKGFPLTDGRASITIPAGTIPSNEWIVVLFGDSGNWSPPFTITECS